MVGKQKLIVHILVILSLISGFLLWSGLVRAQSAVDNYLTGVAYQVQMSDTDVQAGQLVSLQAGEYALTQQAYDDNLVGVVVENPPFLLSTQEAKGVSIVSTGQAWVWLADQPGEVAVGKWLTSSDQQGRAQLLDRPGIGLGEVLDLLTDDQGRRLALVLINIQFYYPDNLRSDSVTWSRAVASLGNFFSLFDTASRLSAPQAFRYLLAAGIVLLSMVFAYFYFAKLAKAGVVALGRNPLARGEIMLGILVNVVISVVILGAGVVTAYLVMVL